MHWNTSPISLQLPYFDMLLKFYLKKKRVNNTVKVACIKQQVLQRKNNLKQMTSVGFEE